MTVVGEGEVPVFPTFKEFRSTVVREVDSSAEESGNRWTSKFGSIIKGVGVGIAAGVTAAVAGAGAIASKGLDRALNIQDAKAQLTGLGHDAASVSTIMESALASVKGTAFGLDQSAQIAASSVAAGIAPGEDLTRILKLTADSATIAKAPLSEMGSIINKVATNQRLTTETMQQFQDRGIPILQAVANQYGVTADEAAGMVSRGEVDFATFQNALESSVGGAALSSGTTARGAFANIGAAFSRMGAMFVQPAVDGAPTLFTSIAGAIDRASVVLAPFAATFAEKLTPAIAAFAGWIDRIDFTNIGASFTGVSAAGENIRSVLALVSPMGPALIAVGKAVADVSGSIGGLLGSALRASTPILDTFSGFFGFLADNAWLVPPVLIAIVGALVLYRASEVAAHIAQLASLPVTAARTAALFALAAATRVSTSATAGSVVATEASVVAQQGSQLVMLRAQAAWIASRVAQLASATATGIATAAQTVWTAAMNGTALAAARQGVAVVASRVAMLAGAAATGIATAAQWAWNAAMTANPIGIIIVAIAALVAGLIWFFTQTELGQDIWANFTRFLGEAWNNIVLVVQTAIGLVIDIITNVVGFIVAVWNTYWNIVFTVISTVWNFIVAVVQTAIGLVVDIITNIVNFIVAVWTTYWNIVFTVISTVWTAIVGFVTAYINLLLTVITAVVNFIVAVWTNTWNAISAVVTFVWTAIVAFITAYINTVLAIITAVVNFIVAVWTNVWNTIVSVFQGIWDAIVGFATGYINTVLAIITAVVTTISDVWNSVWGAISSFFIGIWDTIVSVVTGAVDTLRSIIDGVVGAISGAVQGIFDTVGAIPGTIMGLLGNLGDLLVNSGRDLIQGFIDGITGMLDSVGDAVGGVMDFIGGFFPHSPAKRGQFSGSGWRRVREGGSALLGQFFSGFGGDDPFGGFPFPGPDAGGGDTPPPAGGGGAGSGGAGDGGVPVTLMIDGKILAQILAPYIRDNNRSLA